MVTESLCCQTPRVSEQQISYGIRNITDEIKHHFEMSPSAVEVLIFTGNKEISVKRNIARSKGFLKMMMNSFRK